MAADRQSPVPGVVPEANEADVEEQHQTLRGDEEPPTAVPHVERVPADAPEADVLEQHRAEPYDDEDYD